MHRADPTLDALLAQTEWLQALTRSLVLDRDTAEDVAQETLLRALCQRDRLRHPRAWLAEVARSVAARFSRGEERRRRREHAAARDEAEPSTAHLVEQVERHRAAADAVLALREPYRSAILLRFFEGLSPTELAQRVGVPVETARTRTKRGLLLLRRRLDRAYGRTSAWAPWLLVPIGHPPLPVTGVLIMSKSKVLIPVAALLAALAVVPLVLDDRAEPPRGGTPPPDPLAAADPDEGDGGTPPADATARRAVPPERRAAPLVVRGRLLDEATQAAVAGAALAVVGAGDPWTRDTAVSAHSDADGRFELTIDGEDGARVLVVRAAELAPHLERLRPPTGTALDLGDVYLAPGTLVAGRVRTADDAPVPGARLYLPLAAGSRLPAAQAADLLADLRPVGRADDTGAFVLDDRLVPGEAPEWLIAVSGRGLGWTRVQLFRKRHHAEVEVRLRPAAGLAVRVTGGGAPVAGARVRAEPLGAPLRSRAGRVERGRDPALDALFAQRTGPDGLAHLPCLPVGPGGDGGAFALVVEAEGFRAHREEPPALAAGTSRTLPVDLARITPCTLSGAVRDARGQPVEGAVVRAWGAPAERARAVTGGDGAFRVEGFRTGRRRLRFEVSAPGFVTWSGTRDLGDPAREHRFAFELREAAALEGRIVDQYGLPVAGAQVRLDGGAATVRSGAQGRFRFADAGAREVTLLVIAPEPLAAFERHPGVRVRPGGAPVEVALRRLAAHELARAEADVVDAATGRPLDPVRAELFEVGARRDTGAPRCRVRIGRVVADGLHAGRWRLRVSAAEGHHGEATFEVRPGERQVFLRVAVGALGAVAGRVELAGIPAALRPARLRLQVRSRGACWVEFDAHGRPGRRQRGVRQGEYVVDLAVTDRFRLEGVDPSGPVTVDIVDARIAGSGRAEVRAGEETALVLRARAKETDR